MTKTFKSERERLEKNIFINGLIIGSIIGMFIVYFMFLFNLFGTAENIYRLYQNEYFVGKVDIKPCLYIENNHFFVKNILKGDGEYGFVEIWQMKSIIEDSNNLDECGE